MRIMKILTFWRFSLAFQLIPHHFRLSVNLKGTESTRNLWPLSARLPNTEMTFAQTKEPTQCLWLQIRYFPAFPRIIHTMHTYSNVFFLFNFLFFIFFRLLNSSLTNYVNIGTTSTRNADASAFFFFQCKIAAFLGHLMSDRQSVSVKLPQIDWWGWSDDFCYDVTMVEW